MVVVVLASGSSHTFPCSSSRGCTSWCRIHAGMLLTQLIHAGMLLTQLLVSVTWSIIVRVRVFAGWFQGAELVLRLHWLYAPRAVETTDP